MDKRMDDIGSVSVFQVRELELELPSSASMAIHVIEKYRSNKMQVRTAK